MPQYFVYLHQKTLETLASDTEAGQALYNTVFATVAHCDQWYAPINT